MIEQESHLWFKDVEVGDLITITTGRDDKAWTYEFGVFDMSAHWKWPRGALKATSPDGQESPIIPADLHGSGIHTTREQNPCQTQSWAITPNFEGLSVGSFLMAKPDAAADRIIMDKPGQEISAIHVAKFAMASL